jgi:hypothetical protein
MCSFFKAREVLSVKEYHTKSKHVTAVIRIHAFPPQFGLVVAFVGNNAGGLYRSPGWQLSRAKRTV